MKRRSYQVPVMENPSSVILSGQHAVTASAVALPNVPIIAVTIKAHSDNAVPVYLGPAGVSAGNGGTGFELSPGDAVTIEVENLNIIYVIATTTGASVSWIAK